jgi:hypothetical protein
MEPPAVAGEGAARESRENRQMERSQACEQGFSLTNQPPRRKGGTRQPQPEHRVAG